MGRDQQKWSLKEKVGGKETPPPHPPGRFGIPRPGLNHCTHIFKKKKHSHQMWGDGKDVEFFDLHKKGDGGRGGGFFFFFENFFFLPFLNRERSMHGPLEAPRKWSQRG